VRKDITKCILAIDYLDKMIRQDMGCLLEPEGRELVENLSLLRDAAGQDDIEGRDAVGGHDEQFIAYVINVPYFAAPK